jgi:hypothetical protein
MNNQDLKRHVLRTKFTFEWLLMLLAATAVLILISCSPEKKMQVQGPQVPYPDQKLALIIQAQVDSSQSPWFLDLKSMVSFYCNDQFANDIKGGISTKDVTVLNESLYHGKAEVKLPKKTIILTLERPFKERREHSIWQVVKLEDKD